MNNTLKMIALTATLALSVAPASFAKPGDKPAGGPGGKMDGRMGGRRGGPGGMMRRMEKDLALTPAQKTKLEALNKTNRDKMRTIRENKSLSPDQKKTQMRAQRDSSMTRMKAILTPTQRAKVAAMQAQMMAQMKQRMQQGGMGAPKGR